jgi:hypothetical protein
MIILTYGDYSKNQHRHSAAGEESLFFFSSKKSKEEILRTYVLKMTDKGKLVKILEQPPFNT